MYLPDYGIALMRAYAFLHAGRHIIERGDAVLRPSQLPADQVPHVVLIGGPGQGKRTLGQLRERVGVYAQVIHELRTELDRRTGNSTQRSPVRSLPTSVT